MRTWSAAMAKLETIMPSLRKRLVVPTALAVSFAGVTIGACLQPKDAPKPDAGEMTIAHDAGPDTDVAAIDAEPMPDSPPDARPDAPLG